MTSVKGELCGTPLYMWHITDRQSWSSSDSWNVSLFSRNAVEKEKDCKALIGQYYTKKHDLANVAENLV